MVGFGWPVDRGDPKSISAARECGNLIGSQGGASTRPFLRMVPGVLGSRWSSPRHLYSRTRAFMADSLSVADTTAAPLPIPADIARAERFVRERFVHEGEDPEVALAPGSARRRALDL